MFSNFLLTQIEINKVELLSLSKSINIDINEVEAWLNDESLPSYIGIIELTKYFGVPVNYWFSGDVDLSNRFSKDEEIFCLNEEINSLRKKSAELETDLLDLIKQLALREKVSYLKGL